MVYYRFSYELRVTGGNPDAARYAGTVLSKNGFDFNAGERDVPEAACFGPVARMVKGPKPAVSVATMA